MLSVALLCVCAVAFGRVSGRSDSGNFLDDKWLTGRWDKFRDTAADSQPAFVHKVFDIPALTNVALGHCALFQTCTGDVSYMGFLVDIEGIIICNGFMMIPFYWLLF